MLAFYMATFELYYCPLSKAKSTKIWIRYCSDVPLACHQTYFECYASALHPSSSGGSIFAEPVSKRDSGTIELTVFCYR